MSRGAQEQAYLALRQNYAAGAEALPLIMDEILVNFDLQRAERTVRAFAALTSGSDGKSHQMLYFTCQPHMADMLRRVAPDAALFAVADGNIRQV